MGAVKLNGSRGTIIHLIGDFYAKVEVGGIEVVMVSEVDEVAGKAEFRPVEGLTERSTLVECLSDACLCYRRDCMIAGDILPTGPAQWALDAGMSGFAKAERLDRVAMSDAGCYIGATHEMEGDTE